MTAVMDRRMTSGAGATWPELTDEQRRRVEENTGLVGFVLRRRNTPTADWDDAFQDGTFGLIRAAQMFDPAKGFRFSTYAYRWIQQSIQRGRAEVLGSGFRRSVERGTDWLAPASLDAPIGEGDGGTLGALALVDRAPGTERRALAALLVDEAWTLASQWELDAIDRAITDDLFILQDDATWSARDQRVAAAFSMSREMVRRRRQQIHHRFRAWGQDVAG